MANYLLAYKGGGMAQTDAEREAAMAAWGGWFGTLGAAIVDAGNPFGPSSTVGSGGAVGDGASSALTGYSVLSADSLAAATELAKGCPVLASGGSVEVYETVPVM
ncbi:MAG TPA: hypothetical protein VES97_08990 [Solirubrobacteraceae bacterium]|nr:hypothetical protein [Solirubrobacteraceae bacterium]HYM65787.1 hypothetical protein [Patescibacteria group bacterium]